MVDQTMFRPDFTTARLHVRHWSDVLADPVRRTALEAELDTILTPNVLAPLPPPLHLPDGSAISDWIAARETESAVCTVRDRRTDVLLGLLILGQSAPNEVRLGYLLADPVWGRGYGTELVRGFLETLPRGQGVTVLAGVHAENAASCGVLYKCGFDLCLDASSSEMRMFQRQID